MLLSKETVQAFIKDREAHNEYGLPVSSKLTAHFIYTFSPNHMTADQDLDLL